MNNINNNNDKNNTNPIEDINLMSLPNIENLESLVQKTEERLKNFDFKKQMFILKTKKGENKETQIEDIVIKENKNGFFYYIKNKLSRNGYQFYRGKEAREILLAQIYKDIETVRFSLDWFQRHSKEIEAWEKNQTQHNPDRISAEEEQQIRNFKKVIGLKTEKGFELTNRVMTAAKKLSKMFATFSKDPKFQGYINNLNTLVENLNSKHDKINESNQKIEGTLNENIKQGENNIKTIKRNLDTTWKNLFSIKAPTKVPVEAIITFIETGLKGYTDLYGQLESEKIGFTGSHKFELLDTFEKSLEPYAFFEQSEALLNQIWSHCSTEKDIKAYREICLKIQDKIQLLQKTISGQTNILTDNENKKQLNDYQQRSQSLVENLQKIADKAAVVHASLLSREEIITERNSFAQSVKELLTFPKEGFNPITFTQKLTSAYELLYKSLKKMNPFNLTPDAQKLMEEEFLKLLDETATQALKTKIPNIKTEDYLEYLKQMIEEEPKKIVQGFQVQVKAGIEPDYSPTIRIMEKFNNAKLQIQAICKNPYSQKNSKMASKLTKIEDVIEIAQQNLVRSLQDMLKQLNEEKGINLRLSNDSKNYEADVGQDLSPLQQTQQTTLISQHISNLKSFLQLNPTGNELKPVLNLFSELCAYSKSPSNSGEKIKAITNLQAIPFLLDNINSKKIQNSYNTARNIPIHELTSFWDSFKDILEGFVSKKNTGKYTNFYEQREFKKISQDYTKKAESIAKKWELLTQSKSKIPSFEEIRQLAEKVENDQMKNELSSFTMELMEFKNLEGKLQQYYLNIAKDMCIAFGRQAQQRINADLAKKITEELPQELEIISDHRKNLTLMLEDLEEKYPAYFGKNTSELGES
ncbi:MAG: hypothetical protein K0S74_1281 [Chlamydiales bacterium]|jgi:hypothetical protein|nr:hypothetical protein [Chlamydiales bacterium]